MMERTGFMGRNGRSVSHPLYLIFAVLLGLPWVLMVLRIGSLQLYDDSLFTVGAGARLASTGHFSQTFLLYGLVNPYMMEVLHHLTGEAAVTVAGLRVFQFALVLLGLAGLRLAGTRLGWKRPESAPFLPILVVFLGSALFMSESFELTPEIPMFTGVCWLLATSLGYDGSWKRGVQLALSLAFLAGTRPTAAVLWIPGLITAGQVFESKGLRRGLPVFLVIIPSLAVLLSGLPLFSSVPVLRVGAVLTVLSALIFLLMDVLAGNAHAWLRLGGVAFLGVLFAGVLFPSYFLHLPLLLRQITAFHLNVEIPANSVLRIADNVLLGGAAMLLVFPGLPALAGVSSALVRVRAAYARKRTSLMKLVPFLAGSVPFILLTSRYSGLQPRYLIPLMPLVFLPAAWGFDAMLAGRRWALLTVPLVHSMVFLCLTAHYRLEGSIINALDSMSSAGGRTYTFHNVFPADPSYYSRDGIPWPLEAFSEGMTYDPRNGEVMISWGAPPEGYTVVGVWSRETETQAIRSSRMPGWTALAGLFLRPWEWRAGQRTCLSLRNIHDFPKR